MREGLAATALGVTLGLAGALLTSRFLEALLFGIEPLDTTTFAAVAILFVVVGALACYLPARRATRVDPVIALRAD
jgi:ABC-type antimicrobial peptide transport system permease subunit